MMENQVLRDGFQIQTDRHREIAQQLEEEGYCEIDEKDVLSCIHCDHKIGLTEETGADIECPQCERTVDIDPSDIFTVESIQTTESKVYSTIRDRFKEATGLPHGTKESLSYREHDVEYRFVLENKQGETIHQAQILFSPPAETFIECARLYSYPVLTILADGAITMESEFERFDLPYKTVGELIDTNDREIRAMLKKADKVERLAHIDDRVRIANKWSTDRQHLEAMDWYEFEYIVQAFLDKLFIQSRLLGGTSAGEEVPDGIMGFTIDEQSYRYFWDAKYIGFDDDVSDVPSSDPHIPIRPNEEHSLSDEYRKIADHAHQYMSDQGLDLDAVVLFSPNLPESQIPSAQQKLESFNHRRDWKGNTIYFPLDALVDLYQRVDRNEGNVRNKRGFLMRAIVDRFQDSDLHNDPDVIENAGGTMKFGIDDVENVFNEIENAPSDHEMPSYEVYVSRSRLT